MKQDLKKLICIIFFLAMSYLLVWGGIFIYYEFSYRIFPVFAFLSTLSKTFFIINITLFYLPKCFIVKKRYFKNKLCAFNYFVIGYNITNIFCF